MLFFCCNLQHTKVFLNSEPIQQRFVFKFDIHTFSLLQPNLASCCLSLPPLHDDMFETGLLAIDGPVKLDADPKADLDTKNKAGAIEVRLKLAG